MATQITQHGVTFNFDGDYTTGQYANGDYYVVENTPGGGVGITSITPNYDDTSGAERNGWEVNPDSPVSHGWDSRISDFDATRVPSLPYTASAGESLVKAISIDDPSNENSNLWSEVGGTPEDRTELQTAVVLTVVASAPASGTFRPSYYGTDKTTWNTSELQTGQLPTESSVANMPTLAYYARRFERLQLDHKITAAGRRSKPWRNMDNYDGMLARSCYEGILRLCHNEPLSGDKLDLLYGIIQYGIDLFGIFRADESVTYHNGRKIIMAFTAYMLDDADMTADVKRWAANNRFFEDSRWLYVEPASLCLWGDVRSEEAYWIPQIANVINDTTGGSRTAQDPYGWIDGGEEPGDRYDQIHGIPSMIGYALIAETLMPELVDIWNNPSLSVGARGAEFGSWTLPDPIRPPSSPDYDTPAEIIADPENGVGRWPQYHGTGTFGSNSAYASAYAESFWTAKRTDQALFMPSIAPYGGTFEDSVEITLERFSRLTPDGFADYWDQYPDVAADGSYPFVDGVELRYTTDGSEPTASSTLYTAPFSITEDTTLKVKAFKSGFAPSSTQQATFIKATAPIVSIGSLALDGLTDSEQKEIAGTAATNLDPATTKLTVGVRYRLRNRSAGSNTSELVWFQRSAPSARLTINASGPEIKGIGFADASGLNLIDSNDGSRLNEWRAAVAVFDLDAGTAIGYDAADTTTPTTSVATTDAAFDDWDEPVEIEVDTGEFDVDLAEIFVSEGAWTAAEVAEFDSKAADAVDQAGNLLWHILIEDTSGTPANADASSQNRAAGSVFPDLDFDNATGAIVYGDGPDIQTTLLDPPDTTAPTVSSATINAAGDTLTIVTSEATTGTAGFSLNGGHSLSNANRVNTTTIEYDVSPVVPNYDPDIFELALSYDQTTGDVADTADTPNDLASFIGFIVTNNSTIILDTTAPTRSNLQIAVNAGGTGFDVSFDTDEQLGSEPTDIDADVSLSGGGLVSLDGSDFAETALGGGAYRYAATATITPEDGVWTFRVNAAADAAGNSDPFPSVATLQIGGLDPADQRYLPHPRGTGDPPAEGIAFPGDPLPVRGSGRPRSRRVWP